MEKKSYFPVCLRLWITGNDVVNDVQISFTEPNCFSSEDLNISSGATGIHFVMPVFAFSSLKVPVAIDLHFMNHARIMVSAKNHLYYSTEEEKVILYGMRASKLTTNVCFLPACWHPLVLVKVNVPPVFSVHFSVFGAGPLGFLYSLI